MNLILASTSPRRQELMSLLGLDFEVVPSNFDEESIECDDAAELSEELALQKAMSVARLHPEALVIGADTVVSLPGTIFGKATNRNHAKEILMQLSSTTHFIHTGVALISQDLSISQVFHQVSQVSMRRLDPSELDEYLNSTHWQDKAGAYGIQEDPLKMITGFTGSYTNILGLPLIHLAEELSSFDFDLPTNITERIEQQTGRREDHHSEHN